ncbi:MAG: glycosyltransferase [Dysgonamonadaceae bacterium]|jgi:glycosyltransferase involved in cell wall biosynthesis|nr:glycosyltransferase [Dysgonamonadaceae bacterium]
MKISIILISYNQQQYIRDCLDGLIFQDLPFEYEIVVADDCSTDDTLKIIEEYLNRAKMNYRILPTSQNLGMHRNYKRAYTACRGEYIAILEGDDYWTAPDRLAKHVNFLDNHRECVLSFNRYISLYEQSLRFEIPKWNHDGDYYYITAGDMASGNKMGNLSTCVFRRSVLQKMTEDLFEMGFADWFLGLFLGQHGLLVKHKDLSSVYRIHSKGLWSGNTGTEHTQSICQMIDLYNKCLDYKYNEEFTGLKRYYQNQGKFFTYRNLRTLIPPVITIAVRLIIPKRILDSIKRRLLQ